MNLASPAAVRPSLLVIDDEADICTFFADVAETAGYAARTASNAGEVAESLKDPADIVVLDLVMPGMDGVQTLRALAAQGSTSKIILVSGYDRRVLETTARLARHLGLRIGSALVKPVRLAALREALMLPLAAPAAAEVLPENLDAAELQRAIEQDEIIVHYQPQVSLATGAWTGTEALVRWQHPHRGLFYPKYFVPLAESAHLILPLTRAIMRRALPEFASLARALDSQATVSINVPPVALTDLQLPEQAVELARLSGIEPRRVVFEVTETTVAKDPALLLDILSRLRMKGFRVAIDDYGTGHSSLEKIRDLPINELKIDLSFVRELETDVTAATIVQNSVQLARSLDLHVVAEGVETLAQWQWLRSMGCHAAQGFFVGRPRPGAGLQQWLSAWQAPQPAGETTAVA